MSYEEEISDVDFSIQVCQMVCIDIGERADKEIRELRELLCEALELNPIYEEDIPMKGETLYCTWCHTEDVFGHSEDCFIARAKKLIGDSDV